MSSWPGRLTCRSVHGRSASRSSRITRGPSLGCRLGGSSEPVARRRRLAAAGSGGDLSRLGSSRRRAARRDPEPSSAETSPSCGGRSLSRASCALALAGRRRPLARGCVVSTCSLQRSSTSLRSWSSSASRIASSNWARNSAAWRRDHAHVAGRPCAATAAAPWGPTTRRATTPRISSLLAS